MPIAPASPDLSLLVEKARGGDLVAYAELVQATQAMVHGITLRLLGERSDALDAAQEAFLRAYRALHSLSEPAAFPAFLRRVAIHTAEDVRRRRRRATFVSLDAAAELPVLDDTEARWSEAQRQTLSRALVALAPADRRVTDRFYHAGWSIARLAEDASVTEPAMRKRLQRIRDSLRKEMEKMESQPGAQETHDLSTRVIELLARPELVDLPENPVGYVTGQLLGQFRDFERVVDLPEEVDVASLGAALGMDPVYVPEQQIFRAGPGRILRYDLTLPLLAHARGRGAPLRLVSAGKVYRNEVESPTHLSAFHQLELLVMDETPRADPWAFLGTILGALTSVVPGCSARIHPAAYPFCTRAWEAGPELRGEFSEALGCGVYRDEIVRLLGGDPARHTAIGVGFGLERLAALRFDLRDMRTVEAARV